MEVIKVFMITKENGEKHIQDAERLAEEFQKYPRLEKVNKVYKERERPEGKCLGSSWADLIVSLWTIKNQAIL